MATLSASALPPDELIAICDLLHGSAASISYPPSTRTTPGILTCSVKPQGAVLVRRILTQPKACLRVEFAARIGHLHKQVLSE